MSNSVHDVGDLSESSENVEVEEDGVSPEELNARVEDLLSGDYVTFEEHNENRD